MRIVFMGTPEYSVPTLSGLLESNHDVIAVFCQPDKPVGRKHIITAPPTKTFAKEHNIPVFQPSTLRDGTALKILKDLSPDIIVVVAYGKILPKEILVLPKYGAINGHASLLPKYRGASPIQWAIISGEKQTGVTIMQMDEGLDTGDIIFVSKTDILPGETAGALFERLSFITADAVADAIDLIERKSVKPVSQDNSAATYTPIIEKNMAHLDFSKTAEKLSFEIRGFNPWPVAFCYLNGKRLKILSAAACSGFSGKAGEIVNVRDRLIIACGDDTALELLTVQIEGGKPMSAADMLKGHKIDIGTVVE